MNQFNYKKLFCWLAFIAFMFISCWATVESLHLLLPSWPKFLFWSATLGTFFLASVGSSMIVDSFNGNKDVDHRGIRLLGGIVLLLLFWVFFSLPTNTHTFFYRSVATDVLAKDLVETKHHLENISGDNIAAGIINNYKNEWLSKVNGLWGKLQGEIMNPGNPGWGPVAEQLACQLREEKIELQPITLRSTTQAGRRQAIEESLRPSFEKQRDEQAALKFDTRLSSVKKYKDQEQIDTYINEISSLQWRLDNDPKTRKIEPTEKTELMLGQSYKIICSYYDAVRAEFDLSNKTEMDRIKEQTKQYEGNVSLTGRLRSVIDVWKDYFNGAWTGMGFFFWILLAALVDLAGFLFFCIAKKD